MSDGAARFAARYPRVWHVIEADGAGAWLTTTGLLPAAELRALPDCRAMAQTAMASSASILVVAGSPSCRPQLMPDSRLHPALAGGFAGRPDLWRRHVDQHVFFWAEERRRDSFVRACMRLRGAPLRPPQTLTIDTAALVERYGPIARFATINTGSTIRGGARARRDESTLRPIADYRSGRVAELAIRGHVDLSGITLYDP